MKNLFRNFTPFLIVFFAALMLAGGGVMPDIADAKAKIGGKSFSSPSKAPAQKAAPAQSSPTQKSGSFSKGLMGGLLGGAIGGMLFGSMFGAGGSGMGILPILLLAGIGYFLYRKFTSAQRSGYSPQGGYQGFPGQAGGTGQSMNRGGFTDIPPPPPSGARSIEEGFAEIRRTDSGFDPSYFKEIASDVFFQVQAGWMRRDIDTFKHLLGDQLSSEYAGHFAEMRAKGVINKLESIAVRKVEISDAGSTGSEDFVTVLFTANLLDYTVSDTSGELVEGSMTEPVKFAEEWTWARPVGTNDWKLEGIKAAN